MKNHILLFSSILLSILLTNCAQPVYYSPPTISDIGLTHQGDIKTTVSRIDANNDQSTETSGLKDLDVTVAYSPIKNIGLYYNTYGYREEFTVKNVDFIHITSIPTQNQFISIPLGLPDFEYVNYSFSQRLSQFGLGYYLSEDSYNFEVYGFTGNGIINLDNQLGHVLDAKMNKSGIRSALTFKVNKFEAGVAMAFSNLTYDNLISSSEHGGYFDYLYEHDQHGLWETGFNLKYNLPGVKLKLEMGTSKSNDRQFEMNDAYSAVGLVFDLDDIFRNLKSK